MIQDVLDVALLVAEAIDATGSEYWRDVVEVLHVRGPDLDRVFLDLWAARLGVDALLARARTDAERDR